MSSLVVLKSAVWKQLTDTLSMLHQSVSQEAIEQSTLTRMVQELESIARQAVCNDPYVVVVQTEHLDVAQIVEDPDAVRPILQRIAVIEEVLLSLHPEATRNSSLPPWTAIAAELWANEESIVFAEPVIAESGQLVQILSERAAMCLRQDVQRSLANVRIREAVELANRMMQESQHAPPEIGSIVETNHGDTCEIDSVQDWYPGNGWAVRVSSATREHEFAYAVRDLTRWVVRFPSA